jgi:HEPN domain-containing protein
MLKRDNRFYFYLVKKNIENIDNVIKFWKDSSNQDYKTMNNLLISKDFHWALFLGHLVVEKLLKALYVKKCKDHPLFTHDLLRLSQKMELRLTNEQEEWLDKISTFNLNARYDNYKHDFYKLCTEEFTAIWIDKIEKLRLWLIGQL